MFYFVPDRKQKQQIQQEIFDIPIPQHNHPRQNDPPPGPGPQPGRKEVKGQGLDRFLSQMSPPPSQRASNSPEEFAAFIENYAKRWTVVVKTAGIKAE